MIKDFIKDISIDLEARINKIYSGLTVPTDYDRIIISGRGIDYAVALSAKEAFIKYSGLPACNIEVSTNMGLTNFDGIAPKDSNTLVITTSVKEDDSFKGLNVLEVFKDSLDCDYENYFYKTLTMILQAKKIGGNADFSDILDYVEKFSQLTEAMQSKATEMSKIHKDAPTAEIISSGPDFGGGYFSRMLCYKMAGLVTTIEETEDWLHVNYLQLNPEKPMCLYFITKDNPAYDRGIRTLKYATGVGRKVFVITDDRLLTADYDIALLPTQERYFSGLLQFVPVAMLLESLGE